jgi:hypothetical protein
MLASASDDGTMILWDVSGFTREDVLVFLKSIAKCLRAPYAEHQCQAEHFEMFRTSVMVIVAAVIAALVVARCAGVSTPPALSVSAW